MTVQRHKDQAFWMEEYVSKSFQVFFIKPGIVVKEGINCRLMMPNPLNQDKTKAVTPREQADLEVNKHFVYQQFSLVKFKLQPAVHVQCQIWGF